MDNSAVHPEAYGIVEKMARDLGIKTLELIANKEKIALIKPEDYITGDIGILGIKDILKELENPVWTQGKRLKYSNSILM